MLLYLQLFQYDLFIYILWTQTDFIEGFYRQILSLFVNLEYFFYIFFVIFATKNIYFYLWSYVFYFNILFIAKFLKLLRFSILFLIIFAVFYEFFFNYIVLLQLPSLIPTLHANKFRWIFRLKFLKSRTLIGHLE